MTEVPVVWFEGSDLDAKAYSIADNRTHEFATWDEPALATLLKQLGKAKMGGGCLYIKSLEGVDQKVLAEMITTAMAAKLQRQPAKAKAKKK